MTRRRVILHVGSPKCGSTYLQKVMLRNAALLEAHGIRYPHDGPGHPGNAGDLETFDRARWDAMFDGDIHTVLLSHEDLYSVAIRGLAFAALAAEDGAEVQIVVFLRPFSEFVFGDFSQFMKQNFETYLASRNPYNGQNFQAFAKRRVGSLQPTKFLTNWQKLFPATPLVVDGHQNIRAVMTRLLGDLPELDWEVPRTETNPSLRVKDCNSLIDAMRNPEIDDDTIREMFHAAFHKIDTPDPGKSDARKTMIERFFALENRLLLETFGYDNRLPGYPPAPPDQDDAPAPDDVSALAAASSPRDDDGSRP